MSRVRKLKNKYMNSSSYSSYITNTSGKKSIHSETEDCHKCKTLSYWLFVKYDMSYGAYRNRSANRREELRAEFRRNIGS